MKTRWETHRKQALSVSSCLIFKFSEHWAWRIELWWTIMKVLWIQLMRHVRVSRYVSRCSRHTSSPGHSRRCHDDTDWPASSSVVSHLSDERLGSQLRVWCCQLDSEDWTCWTHWRSDCCHCYCRCRPGFASIRGCLVSHQVCSYLQHEFNKCMFI